MAGDAGLDSTTFSYTLMNIYASFGSSEINEIRHFLGVVTKARFKTLSGLIE